MGQWDSPSPSLTRAAKRPSKPTSTLPAPEPENFPVALRILPRAYREDLLALYRYARYVDTVGDEPVGEHGDGDRVLALKTLISDVELLYDGGRPEIPAVAGLATVITRRDVPIEPWLRLAQANLQDQTHPRYASFDELLDYCVLSANPVGQVVLHIFGQATPDRLALSDRVCTGLQLIEHWQDVAEDYQRGRVYLPQEDLRRFGVPERALEQSVATPEVTALLGYQTDRALAWLNSGAVLVSTLRGWARVAVSGYVAGGRAAAEGLRRASYDPLRGVPKPTGSEIGAAWARALVRSPG